MPWGAAHDGALRQRATPVAFSPNDVRGGSLWGMSSAAPKLPPDDDASLRFAPSPTIDWINAHVEELHARYAGQYVAIDPARGVLASGSSDGAVAAELDRLGVPREADVTITWMQ